MKFSRGELTRRCRKRFFRGEAERRRTLLRRQIMKKKLLRFAALMIALAFVFAGTACRGGDVVVDIGHDTPAADSKRTTSPTAEPTPGADGRTDAGAHPCACSRNAHVCGRFDVPFKPAARRETSRRAAAAMTFLRHLHMSGKFLTMRTASSAILKHRFRIRGPMQRSSAISTECPTATDPSNIWEH